MKHVLADGSPVVLGMRVKDYDAKYGVILDNQRNERELDRSHVPGERSTCTAWFQVLRDDGTQSSMDCSRMIAQGGRWDQ
jgi:hypothetical protein